jgi:hypothetical protein
LDQIYSDAGSVRYFIGVFRAMGMPQMVIGAMFAMDWKELARFEAGDDATWDGKPAAFRASVGEAFAAMMAHAEQIVEDTRGSEGEFESGTVPTARSAPPEPADGDVAPAPHDARLDNPPSLVRRVVAELRQAGRPADQVARVLSLTAEELARLEAGEEAVWAGKPPDQRLRALAGLSPLVSALDPQGPWPAPPAGDGARPRWGRFSIEDAEPDGSDRGSRHPHDDGRA